MLNQLENYRYQLDEALVLHFMGYGESAAVSEQILDVVRDQMSGIESFSDHWGATVEVPLAKVNKEEVVLQKEGGSVILRSRQLPKILSRCDAVVVLLVTTGAQISSKSRSLQDQNPLEAFILDAIGSAMVVELMKSLTRQVFDEAQRRSYGTTLRLGPGYTGWHIEDQAVLFSYFDAETIPVLFKQDSMMYPEKTLLAILGLRPNGKEAPEIEPCRVCDLPECRMRKFEFRGIPAT